MCSSAALASKYTNKMSALTETKQVAPVLTQGSCTTAEKQNHKASKCAMNYKHKISL